jgi:hypothetical protein
MLAHINPQEAGILKLLGGSGTINPHTGLREFSFLNSIGLGGVEQAWTGAKNTVEDTWSGAKNTVSDVTKELGPYGPLILGAALTGGMNIAPMYAAMGVGATYGIANNSLSQGLKAGFGAYGGANIAQQLGYLGAAAGAEAGAGSSGTLAAGTSAGGSAPAVAGYSGETAVGMGGAPVSDVSYAASSTPGVSTGTVNPTATPMPQDYANAPAASNYTDTLRNTYNQVADTASSAYDKMANSDIGKGMGEVMSNPKAALAKTNLGYTEAAAVAMPGMEIAANEAEKAQQEQEAAARQKFEENQIGDIHNFEYDPTTMSYVPKGTRQVKYTPGELYGQTYDPSTGTYTRTAANGGIMSLNMGGVSDLGSYSDGGRMLRGPGDGVSDSIPAMIGGKQPARLADGEFVVPARIVSELGNGSSEAGARKLYSMMDRIQNARSKTTGKHAVATNSRAEKYLPA